MDTPLEADQTYDNLRKRATQVTGLSLSAAGT